MIGRRTFLGAVAGLAAAPAFSASGRPEVMTSLGRVRGVAEGEVSVFRGIRYGLAERFRAPVAPPPSRDVVEARDYGPSCPQTGLSDLTKSEDCLHLNVWTPGADARAGRPVMVYFHGGAYSSGSADSPLLDGRHLAAQGDIVVVTVGHRLNAFGYLYLARLDPRFPDSGNCGQLDLILALRWVGTISRRSAAIRAGSWCSASRAAARRSRP